VAAPGAMAGARLIDVEKLQQVSASRQRRLLSRMGELGHTSVTPRVAPRVREEDYVSPISPLYLPHISPISPLYLPYDQVREEDYDGVMLPYALHV